MSSWPTGTGGRARSLWRRMRCFKAGGDATVRPLRRGRGTDSQCPASLTTDGIATLHSRMDIFDRFLERRRTRKRRRQERRTAVHVRVGPVPVGLTAPHADLVREELKQAGQNAPSFEGKWPILRSPDEMRVVAEAVGRVRAAHPEFDTDRYAWDLSRLQAACELVASGMGNREIGRELVMRRHEFKERVLAANPPSRREVYTHATWLILVVVAYAWALNKEIHYHRDKGATKIFIIVAISVVLVYAGFPLFSGFMARTQMAEPWIPLFLFLDARRLNLSFVAGAATYTYIVHTNGGHGSSDFYRAAGDLIALLTIALAVEARLSASARRAIPFRGVFVLVWFGLVGFGEYTCLRVLASHTATRPDFAVVSGVLVGMGVAIGLLAALGPMPFERSADAIPLRPPPPSRSRRDSRVSGTENGETDERVG